MNLNNIKACYSEKTLEKYIYLSRIIIFLAKNKAQSSLLVNSIGIWLRLKDVIYTTKAFIFVFNAALTISSFW